MPQVRGQRSEQTFYRWKRRDAGVGVAELRRLKPLKEENRKLKQLVADLALDKHMRVQARLRSKRSSQKSFEAD